MAESTGRGGPAPLPPAGLCAACRHAETLASPRSTFLRCRRADREPGYPRYPTLPVVACRGFEATSAPRESGALGTRR